jgi:Peptidase family M1 domain
VIARALLLFILTLIPLSAYANNSELNSLYQQVRTFQIASSYPIQNAKLIRGAATFEFKSGQIQLLEPVKSRSHALLFTGQGTFVFEPPTPIERDQLNKFTGSKVLREPFRTILLRFTDSTAEELSGSGNKGSGLCSKCKEVTNKILKRYRRNVDSRILRDLYSGSKGYFLAYIFGESHGEFLLEIDPEQEEPISLNQYKTDFIDTWSSFSNDPQRNVEELVIPHFEVELKIEKDGKIQATSTLNILPHSDLQTIPLNFSPLLEVKEITDDRGAPSFYVYETAEDRIGEPPIKQSTLDVFLPAPFIRGESRKLKVVYSSEHLIKKVPNRDEYEIHDTTGWYPNYGYLMRSSSRVTYCYPKDLQLFAVGKKVKDWKDGEKNCSIWEQKQPVGIVSFAIGDFKHKNLQVEGLPPADIFSGKHHSGIRFGGNPLENVAADIVNSIHFFQTIYAPYPFEQILATEIPAFHGQGFPGLLHLSGFTFEDTALAGTDEAFRAHEVSHQWWGHLVGWKTYHDQWISEAFAEFSGALYADTAFPKKDLMMKMVEAWKDDVLNQGSFRIQRYGAPKLASRFTMGTESGPIWIGQRLSSSKSPHDYGLLVYQKGAYVLHMLRMIMKDFQTNSDERFLTMMQDFAKTYSWKSASTEDFQRIAEKHYGNSLKWFFDQWVYGTHVPKYSFRWHTESGDGNQVRLVCEIQQTNVPTDFKMPVPIYFDFGNGRFAIQRVIVDTPRKTVQIELPEKPRKVMFNYYRSVLCYD